VKSDATAPPTTQQSQPVTPLKCLPRMVAKPFYEVSVPAVRSHGVPAEYGMHGQAAGGRAPQTPRHVAKVLLSTGQDRLSLHSAPPLPSTDSKTRKVFVVALFRSALLSYLNPIGGVPSWSNYAPCSVLDYDSRLCQPNSQHSTGGKVASQSGGVA